MAWTRAGGKGFAKALFSAPYSPPLPQVPLKCDLRSPGLASLDLLLSLAVVEIT